MGQAFDAEGRLTAEAFGATKREVFDKLIELQPEAHEIRIHSRAHEGAVETDEQPAESAPNAQADGDSGRAEEKPAEDTKTE